MNTMNEEWKPIPGYEDLYQVSNTGKVKRLPKGKLLKPWKDKGGYPSVKLCKGGKRKFRYVHRLVLEAFVGECPDGMECLHADGNPANNKIENLIWGSHSENILDTVRHGRHRNIIKSHCPRGHELFPENLTGWSRKKGYRTCRSCARTHSYLWRHPELQDEFQRISDRYYQAILKEGA